MPTDKSIRSGAAAVSEGIISPEYLEEWKERVGLRLRISNVFNQLASYEAIRNYANGVGDPNPLFRDREYARTTRYGRLVAPPSWLYSVFPTWVLQGLPGVHAFHSGNDWRFYKPVREGDVITPGCIFSGFDVKESAFAERMVMEHQRASFSNQTGALVARADVWLVRAERQAARRKGKYHTIPIPHPWTPAALAQIDQDVGAEQARGNRARYWEDVKVGEELVPVVKGPLGLTDMVAYCVGAAPVQLAAHGVQLQLYGRHPAWAFRDPETSAWEPVYGVHYNRTAARAAGLPYPYDVGVQRQGWLIHLLTNWMGDEGWLKRNRAEYRKFVYLSDAVWVRGKVVRKYLDEDGESCVDVETHVVNQRQEDTMPGMSTVVLPSRKAKAWPLARRLPAQS